MDDRLRRLERQVAMAPEDEALKRALKTEKIRLGLVVCECAKAPLRWWVMANGYRQKRAKHLDALASYISFRKTSRPAWDGHDAFEVMIRNCDLGFVTDPIGENPGDLALPEFPLEEVALIDTQPKLSDPSLEFTIFNVGMHVAEANEKGQIIPGMFCEVVDPTKGGHIYLRRLPFYEGVNQQAVFTIHFSRLKIVKTYIGDDFKKMIEELQKTKKKEVPEGWCRRCELPKKIKPKTKTSI